MAIPQKEATAADALAPSPDPASAAPASPQTVKVPKSALDMNGSSPEMGDPVEFSVTGTCSGEDGDNYLVSLESANGDPIPDDDGPDQEGAGESSDDMEQALRSAYPAS